MMRGEEDRIPPAPEEIPPRDGHLAPWSVEKGINSHKKWIAAQRQTANGIGRGTTDREPRPGPLVLVEDQAPLLSFAGRRGLLAGLVAMAWAQQRRTATGQVGPPLLGHFPVRTVGVQQT